MGDGFSGMVDGTLHSPSHNHGHNHGHSHSPSRHTVSPSATPQDYTPDPVSDIEAILSTPGQVISCSSPEFLIRLLPLVAQRLKEAKKLGESINWHHTCIAHFSHKLASHIFSISLPLIIVVNLVNYDQVYHYLTP